MEMKPRNFFRGDGFTFRGVKLVHSEVAGEAVVELNKMFFNGNCLQSLDIQTVVHLRSAAGSERWTRF